ncbi:MAG: hypothetical protein IJZ46_05725 [Bacilli bacterium]|nr:hypothetical protein [Bacilli bacterium]
MSKFIDRTGEVNIAKNGLKMTIIACRSSKDIDIQFEDGTIVKNKTYQSFKKGTIKNLNINYFDVRSKNCIEKMAKKYIGNTNLANNGQKMTVIAYRKSDDIDVQFEDGTIITNKSYMAFKKGQIRNPNIKLKRLGEINTAKNGMKMTIIAYRDYMDIDVQFEDNIVVTNTRYDTFKAGNIKHPHILLRSSKRNERIGNIMIASNGQKMTIIAYRNARDIDIEFEDGTIVTNRDYREFKNGLIRNPNLIKQKDKKDKIKNPKKKLNKVGETRIACNGQNMTIIAYRKSNDIDIKFEDGTVVTNKSYCNFKKGLIKNPNNIKLTLQQQIKSKVGETRLANNGMKMTVIAYRSCRDMDVQFEDGTIVEHINSGNWNKGKVKHPNLNSIQYRNENKRVGEINTASNGQKMTIIAYKSASDIDVQFEDGTIVTNKQYLAFLSGRIQNPNKPFIRIDETRINETNIAKNGMKMKIIAYRNSNDIDIKFESGAIFTNKYYNCFKTGDIKHSFPYQMDNILLERLAYLYNDIGNFYCSCSKCGHRDIWTIDEAKNHKCEVNTND